MDNIIVTAPSLPGGSFLDGGYQVFGPGIGVPGSAAISDYLARMHLSFLDDPDFMKFLQELQDEMDKKDQVDEEPESPQEPVPDTPDPNEPIDETVVTAPDLSKPAAATAAAIPMAAYQLEAVFRGSPGISKATIEAVLKGARITLTRANIYLMAAYLSYEAFQAINEALTAEVEGANDVEIDHPYYIPHPGVSPEAGESELPPWIDQGESVPWEYVKAFNLANQAFVSSNTMEEVIVVAPRVRPGVTEFVMAQPGATAYPRPITVQPAFQIPGFPALEGISSVALGYPARPNIPASTTSPYPEIERPGVADPTAPGIQDRPNVIPGEQAPSIPVDRPWDGSISIAPTINGLKIKIRTNDRARTKAQSRARAREQSKQRKDKKHVKHRIAYRMVMKFFSQTLGTVSEMLDFANILQANMFLQEGTYISDGNKDITTSRGTTVADLPLWARAELWKDIQEGRTDLRNIQFDMDQAIVDYGFNQAMDLAIGRTSALHNKAFQDMGMISGIRSNPIQIPGGF